MTRRENTASTVATYSQPSHVRTYVMSPTHSRPRTRAGARGHGGEPHNKGGRSLGHALSRSPSLRAAATEVTARVSVAAHQTQPNNASRRTLVDADREGGAVTLLELMDWSRCCAVTRA